jgi:subtilisin-like proprotein convertase family protein
MAIPDNTPAGAVSSIIVPGAAGIIKDLDVSLSITHTFNADLDVSLTHVPSGITLFLFTDVNGGGDGMSVRLSDEAATAIEAASVPPAGTQLKGTFKPETPAMLHTFDGLDASGEWQLKIVDDSAGATGVLNGWALHFTF